MNIEVREKAMNSIMATGALTEMGPIFSPTLPTELHQAIAERLEALGNQDSASFTLTVSGKDYLVQFSN